MKTMKKIASIILTLLLMVGMVSVNGTTVKSLPKRLKNLNIMPALALVVVIECILPTQWRQQSK